MRQISLDARLSAIANMTPICDVAADIGADHGQLSAYLLQNNIVREMYISDISAASLGKAVELFDGDELEKRANFRVGDGLENVDADIDACIIAGMGGEVMRGILTRGLNKLKKATLILEPNVDAPEIRRYLYENGFEIADEDLIFDGRWWYPIIKAEPNANAIMPNEIELEVGTQLIKKRHALLGQYAARQTRILDKAMRSLPAASDRFDELAKLRNIWKSFE